MTMSERRVAGTIDAGGVYTAKAVAADGWILFAASALDARGRLAEKARPLAPYELSEPARSRAQTRYFMEELRDLLPTLGSSLTELVQLEQYASRKTHVDPYFKVALGAGLVDKEKPTAATAQTGELMPEGAAMSVAGIAIVPDPAKGWTKEYPGADPAKSAMRQFSDIVAVGPYAFTTYFPTDQVTGIDPAVRTQDWNWRGSEIASEATFGVKTLTEKMALAGATSADLVHYTLYLADPADLYEFDLVWKAAFGDKAPARTVIPAKGFAVPRREGAFGHAEGALRMELQARFLRPDRGATKQIVEGPGHGFGYQSAGVKAGGLLWISSQYAPANAAGDAAREAGAIFAQLAEVARSAGTDLSNTMRVRAIVKRASDAGAVYAALKKAVPKDPPAVTILVAAQLPVPGASLTIDAVVHAG
jgi:enamine deaminase RidA (YjgF/YER057c/UK114 family)